MEFAQFPKNLAYNIKTLSGFSKSTVVLTPDKYATVNQGDTIKVKLPANTIVDLRTLTMHFKGTCDSAAGSSRLHFPRLSSSLIKTLAVYINGTLIERIDNYNTLYNKLYDLDGGGVDQTAKRFLENSDPSIGYKMGADSNDKSAGNRINKCLVATPNDTNEKFMVNNWLGFLSTSSCPCPDTNDLNNVEIEITFDNEKVLYGSGLTGTGLAGAGITSAGAAYKLEDVKFTISKIIFNDPLYYNLKASQMLSSGLMIGYQTYITSKQASFPKGTSVNVLTTVNTTSLDQIICCLQPADTPISKLQLNGTNNEGSGKTFNEVFSTSYGPSANNATENAVASGDLYNQSVYFKSDATGLISSSLEINNTPLMPQPLDDATVYNETLISLGNLNQDMSSGIHVGCCSLSLFLKYYFAHIVSLENIQQGDFYKSGLDGRASALNIAWKMVFNSASTASFIPYIFCKTTRIMQVMEGHSVTVIV
jgi:hypothetical protein